MDKKRIAIFGSTGSIGTQALEVISAHPDKFEVEALTTFNRHELLIQQAFRFVPKIVVVANEEKYPFVKEALAHYPTRVLTGQEGLLEVARMDSADMVLSAMVGYAGLIPTLAAIEAGKDIALANKETLVVAGELVMSLARQKKVRILPVDSEHSAIFQCLMGEEGNAIEKIILTASGGPFRTRAADSFHLITPEEALNHPNWCMGSKITIDSATLMNKGFEAIEARWLFDLKPEQIEVVIHPQSIIHSLVQFTDGSIKAQLGLPDMRLPIQLAFSYPHRLQSDFSRFSFANFPQLTFEAPDTSRFPSLGLAMEAMHNGGNTACVLNAANEIAVDAFLCRLIGFNKIPQIIEQTIHKIPFINRPGIEDYKNSDEEARQLARSFI
jgi:1-deoxy-D-xylulose-5-phosphate reductoisomerase